MKVRDLLSEREYVLREDRELPTAEQTVWVIKGLAYDVHAQLQGDLNAVFEIPAGARRKRGKQWEEALDNAPMKMEMGGGRQGMNFKALKHGLVAVRNLLADTSSLTEEARQWFDEATGEIRYPADEADNVKKKWLAHFVPPAARQELTNEIIEGSTLDQDEAKNSSCS